MSLIDYPGAIAAVIFTQGCPFRCPYCHNPELIETKEGEFSVRRILAELAAGQKILDGVCITGGEPTMQSDLIDFIRKIKTLRLKVKLDTNGSNPEMLKEIIDEGLVDYIAMDVKHVWGKYAQIIGTKNAVVLRNCKKTFRIIQDSGIDHEFRTTLFPREHSSDEIVEIAGYMNPGERYVLQDIRYGKTLDPNINKDKELFANDIVPIIREKYSEVDIALR